MTRRTGANKTGVSVDRILSVLQVEEGRVFWVGLSLNEWLKNTLDKVEK